MKFDMAKILELPDLPHQLTLVEDTMVKSIATDNPYIKRPLERIVKAPSKRLRSSLLIGLVTKSGGSIDQNVVSACAAIELTHLASLVHDDIMDDAATRWNIRTINSQEGVNHAIVLGDYLFTKAYLVAVGISTSAATTIADTIIDLCDGQIEELAAQHDTKRTTESYNRAVAGKTGSLIAAACKLAGLHVGYNEDQLKALQAYGAAFGMTFQVVDDVLDIVADEAKLGKPTGNDIREGVYTLPIIISLKNSPAAALRAQLKTAKIAPPGIADILMDDGSIATSIKQARTYARVAERALEPLENDIDVLQLQTLPNDYVEWALSTLVAPIYKSKLK